MAPAGPAPRLRSRAPCVCKVLGVSTQLPEHPPEPRNQSSVKRGTRPRRLVPGVGVWGREGVSRRHLGREGQHGGGAASGPGVEGQGPARLRRPVPRLRPAASEAAWGCPRVAGPRWFMPRKLDEAAAHLRRPITPAHLRLRPRAPAPTCACAHPRPRSHPRPCSRAPRPHGRKAQCVLNP